MPALRNGTSRPAKVVGGTKRGPSKPSGTRISTQIFGLPATGARRNESPSAARPYLMAPVVPSSAVART